MSTRVVVEITSGPATGRKMRLGSGQELRVGRTEWADFSVTDDAKMSAVHFAVRTEGPACYLADLGSSNGTFVNGQPAGDRTPLADGDEVLAGETHFVVRVESDPGGPTVPPSTASPPQAHVAAPNPAAAATPAALPPQVKARFTVETCPSGLTLCRGSIEELGPGKLAARIGERLPPTLIVDFRKMGSPPPADLAERNHLFAWLDPRAAEIASPLVIAASETGQWQQLLDGGWGNDSVVCFFSRTDRAALVEHFRRVARVKGPGGDRGGGVLGYCWPSVMAMLLAHGQTTMVRTLLAGIDAVLVELPDLPETWQVYGANSVVGVLEGLGLLREAAEPALASPGGGQTDTL